MSNSLYWDCSTQRNAKWIVHEGIIVTRHQAIVLFFNCRDYFVPLLYDIKEHFQQGYPYHIVNGKGEVVDQNGRTIDGVQLTEDARVINQFGQILPGAVYTQDGFLVTGPLVIPHRHHREQEFEGDRPKMYVGFFFSI